MAKGSPPSFRSKRCDWVRGVTGLESMHVAHFDQTNVSGLEKVEKKSRINDIYPFNFFY